MSEEDSLPFHHWLIADTRRTGAYQKAISQVVRKNDAVLDIGAGSGILSFFACLAGARKVYAVEMSGALPLARELCAGNGFNDIVEFRQGRSQEIQLPEPVDVIVSDTGCSLACRADCWAYCSTPESASSSRAAGLFHIPFSSWSRPSK